MGNQAPAAGEPRASFWKRIYLRLLRRKVLGPFTYVLTESTRRFLEHDGLNYSASLGFYSLLSGIAFIILLLGVGGAIFAHLTADGNHQLLSIVSTYAKQTIPYIHDEVIELLKKFSNQGLTYGIVGLASLIITISFVFTAFQSICDQIFRRDTGRNVIVSQTIGTLALFGGTLLLIMSEYILFVLYPFLARFGVVWIHLHWMIMQLFALVVGVLSFLLILYLFAPRSVPTRHRIIGGLLFYLLIRSTRSLFELYLSKAVKFNVIYGSLASLVVLILWIQLAATIFIWCLEMVRVLEERSQQHRQLEIPF